MARIEEEINQKEFKSEYQKAHVNIIYTASWLTSQMNSMLKPYNISMQQFNLLRILRGADPKPVSVKILTDRMLDKMSNASRLVEKLRKKGLVERTVSSEDRRRVDIIITELGLQVINEASELIEDTFQDKLNKLGIDKATMLNQVLDEIRD